MLYEQEAEGCRDVPLPDAIMRGHVTEAQARRAENGTCPLTKFVPGTSLDTFTKQEI